MQVKVDILEGLQRKITVELPAEGIEKQVSKSLRKAQKTAKIDGFRRGKVPMQIVQQRYGAGIRQEAIGDLLDSSYKEAIQQEKIDPAGSPSITINSGFAANESFVYEATVEVMPEFEIQGLDTLKVKKPVAEVTEGDVDNMIDKLRQQAGNWGAKDGASVEGDQVTIDFTGKLDGEAFEGGNGTDMPVILGSKQMLPEFEDALFDKKAGDETTASVTFPADYGKEEFSGKTAEFVITVKSVEQRQLAELNEAFIQRLGISDGSEEELRKSIRDNMKRELENGLRGNVKVQVTNHFAEANKDIMLPNSLVEEEKANIAKEQRLEEYITDEAERKKMLDKHFAEPARRRVLLSLVMGKLVKDREINVDQARITAHIENIASSYEDPAEVRAYYEKNQDALMKVYWQVMDDQLIDELMKDAEVTEENKTFDDIMQKED